MKKMISLVSVNALFAVSAYADGFELEIGYSYLNFEDRVSSILFSVTRTQFELGAIYAIGGYRWDHGKVFSSSAELMLGTGIDDDSSRGTNFSLDSMYGVAYKANWRFAQSQFDLYVRGSFTQFEIDPSRFSDSSIDGSRFGATIGVAYRGFTISQTQTFEDRDDVSFFNAGYQFKF